MAENETQENAAAGPQPGMRVLTQFIRDLSFENILAQKGIESDNIEPTMAVGVNLDARKRPVDDQYEIKMRLSVHSKDKTSDKSIFLLELDYCGIFEVVGVSEDQLHPFLLIECPRFLFPFARRIVSDVTRDGGFAPINLENIDFVQLYRQELMRRQQESATENAAPAEEKPEVLN